MWTISNFPYGRFFQMIGSGIKEVSACYVAEALIHDGAGEDSFHSVVDLGVSNMGRFGIAGKRLFLFVPSGQDLRKARGLSTQNLKDLGVLQ